MIPFYALVTYALFYNSRLYYAEALVLNLYMVAFMSLIIIPVNSFSFFFNNGIISLMEIALLLGYNVWTYLNFFDGKNRTWVILKTFLSIMVCYLMFQLAAKAVMAWVM